MTQCFYFESFDNDTILSSRVFFINFQVNGIDINLQNFIQLFHLMIETLFDEEQQFLLIFNVQL